MSAGADAGANILLNDTPADVKKKINKYAFSGGGVTLEEHKKNGGNVQIDIPF
jgi:tryptophanyl-tRNA synthetase